MATLLFLIYLIFTLIVLYRAMDPLVWGIGSVVYLIAATFFIGLPLDCWSFALGYYCCCYSW